MARAVSKSSTKKIPTLANILLTMGNGSMAGLMGMESTLMKRITSILVSSKMERKQEKLLFLAKMDYTTKDKSNQDSSMDMEYRN